MKSPHEIAVAMHPMPNSVGRMPGAAEVVFLERKIAEEAIKNYKEHIELELLNEAVRIEGMGILSARERGAALRIFLIRMENAN